MRVNSCKLSYEGKNGKYLRPQPRRFAKAAFRLRADHDFRLGSSALTHFAIYRVGNETRAIMKTRRVAVGADVSEQKWSYETTQRYVEPARVAELLRLLGT